ncbi:hypothetical protein ZIOFF_069366 [Zingiber officinale]|uniref:Reverse transcriptase Ty1/copia-type domain-containing protein n=1 Tax=Zingiber officinale TaxID=94328 RepID=A0A8J5C3R4_ZINOF|nr:hypothetical protein ZIOFF_069366 [Zingiber officinale]
MLLVDDLIVTGNNPKMFEDFKRAMTKEFEILDIGIMSYYLGIEVKQRDDGIFISQEGYAKEFIKKFDIKNCKLVGAPVECGIKPHMNQDGEKVNPTLFKNLVGSLRISKRILCYIKGTINYGILFAFADDFKLVGYCDSD